MIDLIDHISFAEFIKHTVGIKITVLHWLDSIWQAALIHAQSSR